MFILTKDSWNKIKSIFNFRSIYRHVCILLSFLSTFCCMNWILEALFSLSSNMRNYYSKICTIFHCNIWFSWWNWKRSLFFSNWAYLTIRFVIFTTISTLQLWMRTFYSYYLTNMTFVMFSVVFFCTNLTAFLIYALFCWMF